MRNRYSLDELRDRARLIRADVVRMVARLGMGYIQQGLGAADLFTALYFSELDLDEADPRWADRDRFLLSTAHNTALFYATMAARGLIPADHLLTYTKDGSPYEVNASERIGPLVEATCGSLGQGLSVGVGMACSLRRRGKASRVYVVLGDGELQEGQVWEAAMAASGHRLANLCLIIDRNFMQVEGHTDEVMAMEPIADKWRAFGWNVIEIDGNDMAEIVGALDAARGHLSGPTCINARTLAGAGVDFLEHRLSHVAALGAEDAARALEQLGELA